MQTRGRLTPAVGIVPYLLQFLLAPCQPMRAVATAPANQRDGLSQDVAAADTSDGRWADRPCLDLTGGAPIPRAAVAPASGGVSTSGGKRQQEGASGGDVRLYDLL